MKLVHHCVTVAATPPNVVSILADDLGWRDTTLYGQTKFHETPNIQRLAQRGMLFTNAYAANPLCSPTRASILTGLYPGRVGITAPAGHLPEEKLEAKMEVNRITGGSARSGWIGLQSEGAEFEVWKVILEPLPPN